MEAILTPDERWKAIYSIESHQEFIEKLKSTFYLTPNASADIQGIFYVIQKLLVHSYFEYEFLDVAATQAKIGLETALKIRYKELTRLDWPMKRNYKYLLEWFQTKNFFESDSEELLDHLRAVRNLSTHADRHTFAGMMSYQHMRITLLLINDTYEDIPKRLERINQVKAWNNHLQELLPQGCLLQTGKALPEMIYLMTAAFLNNKVNPNVIHISYKTIFPIPVFYKMLDPIDLYPLETLTCHSVDCGPGYLFGKDQNGKILFKVVKISHPGQKNTWESWKMSFEKYRETVFMFDHANSYDLNEQFIFLLASFQRA